VLDSNTTESIIHTYTSDGELLLKRHSLIPLTGTWSKKAINKLAAYLLEEMCLSSVALFVECVNVKAGVAR